MNPVNATYSASTTMSARESGYIAVKRFLDCVSAGLGLVVLAPVMLVIAAIICIDSPGGALFRQERVGRNNSRFFLLKFRSMRKDAPTLSTADMQKQTVSHVTRVGAFLRRTSLDEIPQLINVLRGEMSLVGPRPALPSQTHLNDLRTAAGVDILTPGITGWAQINGRDELGDEQKVAHDAYYRHHRSLKLDGMILVRTLATVFTGRGNR